MLQKENKMNGIEKLIPQSGYMEVHFEGNPKRIENMSYSSLINFIDRATVEKESIKVFPNHAGVSTISYLKSGGAEHIFLKRSAGNTQYQFDRIYSIPCPTLIFALTIRNGLLQHINVAAAKQDTLNEMTPVFIYPFTNAGGNTGALCSGSFNLQAIKKKKTADYFTIPEFVLTSRSNQHYFKHKKGYDLKQYLSYLEENQQFDFENLMPSGMTLKEFIGACAHDR